MNEGAFEQFLRGAEPEASGDSARYKRFRKKLIKFFQWKRCIDAEDLADEVILILAKKTYSGAEIQTKEPYAYAYGIAQNVLREYIRKVKKESFVELSEADGVSIDVEEPSLIEAVLLEFQNRLVRASTHDFSEVTNLAFRC